MKSNTYKIQIQKLKGSWVIYIILVGIFFVFINKIIALSILLIGAAFYIKYRKDPENTSALYYNLAINLYNKNEINKAKQALSASINYNKLNKDACFFLGCIFFDEKDYKNALELLTQGGADTINDPSLVYVLGRCYYHVEQYTKAISYLTRISYEGMESLEKERLFTLGKAYSEQEEYKNGYEILSKLEYPNDELKGDVLEYYYYLSICSYYTNNDSETKELIKLVYDSDKYYKFIDIYAKEVGIA